MTTRDPIFRLIFEDIRTIWSSDARGPENIIAE